ncbi:50S ribosomal protein L2 [Nanoarchaeota archaeon]
MGKRIIQQRRGKGTTAYRTHGFKFKGEAKLHKSDGSLKGEVIDLINCPGHSAPLVKIRYEDGKINLTIAPEGIYVGEEVSIGESLGVGNILSLRDIPEGTSIYNIERLPGDGGKFVRSSGTFAKIVAKTPEGVTVKLPSKKEKIFLPECRACIGIVAGAGRLDKPWLKAGKRFHAMRARNKLYPSVSGTSMNAVDHPFGGTTSSHKGRPTIAPHNAPPGRKVGKIRARRTGRRKK